MTSRQAGAYPWQRQARRVRGWTLTGSKAILVLIAALVGVALGVGLGAGAGWFAATPPSTPSPTPSSASPSPGPSFAIISSAPWPAATLVTVEATIEVDKPIGMASDGEALWVLTEGGQLVRIDPTTNTVSDTVGLDGAPYLYNGIAADASGVWATRWSPGLVYRVDPTTRATTARIETNFAKGVLVDGGAVWVANTHDGTVSQIDPATNKVAETITVGRAGNSGPNWLASGLGSIWVGIPNESRLVRIDPRTNTLQASIVIPPAATACGGIAVGTDTVWMPSCDGSDWLTRIDPVSNTVAAILDMGGRGFAPRIVNGALWISVDRGTDPTNIVRVDQATNQFDRVLSPGDGFHGGGDMVAAAGSMWVADGASGRVLRLPLSAFAP
jgi:YVTN family beta-propeller protein